MLNQSKTCHQAEIGSLANSLISGDSTPTIHVRSTRTWPPISPSSVWNSSGATARFVFSVTNSTFLASPPTCLPAPPSWATWACGNHPQFLRFQLPLDAPHDGRCLPGGVINFIPGRPVVGDVAWRIAVSRYSLLVPPASSAVWRDGQQPREPEILPTHRW